MTLFASFIVGAIFALGLGVAGMTQPAKVIGFLDFTGDWDPSLAFVMGGALLAYYGFYRLVRGGGTPVLGGRLQIPTNRKIDWRLISGAGLFGVGWGLAGFCPGPALTALGGAAPGAIVFVAAMFVGMTLFRGFDSLAKRTPVAAVKPQGAHS